MTEKTIQKMYRLTKEQADFVKKMGGSWFIRLLIIKEMEK